MRAVVVAEDGGARLADLPTPRPRNGEVLVRVAATGLCGSDVEKLRPGGATPGSVLGHEIAGVVEDGAMEPGTRVVVAHRVPCGECETCLRGNETCCPQFLASGLRPGGFCERLVAPPPITAAAVLPLPDDVGDVAATFVEPLACVLRGCEALPAGRGVVVGCGVIGRLFLRALAGGDVRAAETDGARLMAALDDAAGVAAAGDELDFAVVTAPAGLGDALAMLRPGGTCLVFAAPAEPLPVDVDRIYRRELVLRGSRSATPRHLGAALERIANGSIPVADLVDLELPLDRFAEGLAAYRTGRAGKVVFRP
jgi:L-iditol 2-dehydrogenase